MHDGHRERLRNRFKREGLSGFEEHNVLELLLFYCIPRKDTNEIAHNLMKEFGSIAAILDAPIERIARVPGMGETSALFLKLIPEVCMRYLESRGKRDENPVIPKTTKDFIKLVMPKFLGKSNEAFLLVCFDNMGRVVYNDFLFEGSVNMTTLDVRLIVEKVINYNASSVLIAHNHPNGIALASYEDIDCTRLLRGHFRNETQARRTFRQTDRRARFHLQCVRICRYRVHVQARNRNAYCHCARYRARQEQFLS